MKIDREAAIKSLRSKAQVGPLDFYCITIKEPSVDAHLDVRLICRQLQDYLAGRQSSAIYPWFTAPTFSRGAASADAFFGVDCYEGLVSYLVAKEHRRGTFDFRITRQFWEHKQIMRLRFMELQGLLPAKTAGLMSPVLKDVENKLLWIHQAVYAAFKEKRGINIRIIRKIRATLTSVKASEVDALNRAVSDLQTVSQ
jgi:hypothetical protein